MFNINIKYLMDRKKELEQSLKEFCFSKSSRKKEFPFHRVYLENWSIFQQTLSYRSCTATVDLKVGEDQTIFTYQRACIFLMT